MPQIEEYRFGRIVVDGQTYTHDLIIYPGRVQGHWWRKEGHRLAPEDLPALLREPPEVLVVGQGSPGLMVVPPATLERLQALGIEVIVEPTARAWQTYNRLRQEKRAVAALHLTC
jgi:hypothetical protein